MALLHESVRAFVPGVREDRPMDADIRKIVTALRDGSLPIGDADFG
jgi:histidine ammonia-lyase